MARVSPTCRGRVLRCVQVKRIRRDSGDSTYDSSVFIFLLDIKMDYFIKFVLFYF